jgi:katanin p60 ATPase-containing subunit A1
MVLAATNRPWDLDEAIRRRLEKRIYIPLPTAVGREQLFKINLKSLQVSPDVDWTELIRLTDGYSGADLASVCRDAAMMPLRRMIAQGIDIMKIHGMQADFETPLTMIDFQEAIKNTSKSVSKDQLDEYANWMKQFGSA